MEYRRKKLKKLQYRQKIVLSREKVVIPCCCGSSRQSSCWLKNKFDGVGEDTENKGCLQEKRAEVEHVIPVW